MTAEVMLHIKKKIIASIPPPILSEMLWEPLALTK